jgi:hypothetical protein
MFNYKHMIIQFLIILLYNNFIRMHAGYVGILYFTNIIIFITDIDITEVVRWLIAQFRI